MINKFISSVSDKATKKTTKNNPIDLTLSGLPQKTYTYNKDDLWSQDIDFLIEIILKQEEYVCQLINAYADQANNQLAFHQKVDLIENERKKINDQFTSSQKQITNLLALLQEQKESNESLSKEVEILKKENKELYEDTKVQSRKGSNQIYEENENDPSDFQQENEKLHQDIIMLKKKIEEERKIKTEQAIQFQILTQSKKDLDTQINKLANQIVQLQQQNIQQQEKIHCLEELQNSSDSKQTSDMNNNQDLQLITSQLQQQLEEIQLKLEQQQEENCHLKEALVIKERNLREKQQEIISLTQKRQQAHQQLEQMSEKMKESKLQIKQRQQDQVNFLNIELGTIIKQLNTVYKSFVQLQLETKNKTIQEIEKQINDLIAEIQNTRDNLLDYLEDNIKQ